MLDTLAGGMVLTRAKLRDSLAVKNERLGEVLESLERRWPVEPNGRGMAAARLIARQGRSRSPYRDKWERNGAVGLCGVRGALGYVTPADRLAGLGAWILAQARSPVAGGARQSGCWPVVRCKRLGERHDGLRLKNGLGGG